jgi:DeoR family glycerol-3-phosphate regulon repressor
MNPEPLQLNKRQAEILDIVQSQGYATIEALAAHFGTSHQTIRRDIIVMDEHRILQRFHGGAGAVNAKFRPLYADKQQLAIQAKNRIAQHIAGLVRAEMTVYLDVGTTAEAVAHAFLGKEGFRVVTSSLNVGVILAGQPGIETILLGGVVRSGDGALVGGLATSVVETFKYDYSFIGFSGFDDDGALMDFDVGKVQVKQAAMRRSREVVAMADSSKYRRQASIRLASLSDLSCLVSDALPPPELESLLAGAGVNVVAV